jgi:hypothetical protein
METRHHEKTRAEVGHSPGVGIEPCTLADKAGLFVNLGAQKDDSTGNRHEQEAHRFFLLMLLGQKKH